MDPQGNATSGLGLDRARLEGSVYDVLVDQTPVEDVRVQRVHFPYLDVVPSSTDLVGAEVELVDRVRAALGGAGAWVVGGAVRDAALGREVDDLDLAVAESPRRSARAVEVIQCAD